MRITFVQSGGFVGAIKGCRIDTAALEPGERARVESLVTTSGITASSTRRSEATRDARQYQIAIERDAAVLRVTCDDRCVPEAARPLVGFLAAKAVPQRPGFGDDVMAEPATVSADQWGRFVGDIVARWSDNGRDMTLVEPFAYVDPRDTRWDAPAGAVVNGASIPRAFWSLIGGPFEGRFRNASVVHDVACESRDREWRQVHRMLYEACRCGGVAAATAKAMYYAVWHFGPRWRIEDRKAIVAGRPQVERVVHDETPQPPTAAQAAAVERYFATHDVDAEAIPTLTIPGAEALP
ncbi:MAG: protealysin inhibitor emfourin [Planctomycetaceae bacterium]